jgi:hypothetical protein
METHLPMRFALLCGSICALLTSLSASAQPFTMADPAWLGHLDKPAAASGPNTYYYTTNSDDAVINFGGSESYWEWETVVVAQSGTLTSLGVQFQSVSANGSLKFGLYDSSNHPVSGASGAVSVTTALANGTWVEVTGLSVSLAAGTYKFVIACTSTLNCSMKAKTASGRGPYQSGNTYASAFSKDPLGSSSGNEGKVVYARIFVQ